MSDLISRIRAERTRQAAAKVEYRQRRQSKNQTEPSDSQRKCSTEHARFSRTRAHPRERRGDDATKLHEWEWVKLADPNHRGFHICKRCKVRVIGNIKVLLVGCV